MNASPSATPNAAVSKAVLKTAGAKVAEKLGRLKPNNELLDYSP